MSSNRWWVHKIILGRRRKRMEIQIFTKDVSGIDEEIEFPQILDRAVELSFLGRTFRRLRLDGAEDVGKFLYMEPNFIYKFLKARGCSLREHPD